METKYSKVFAKKLLALFLSVLMALTCFTGALNAFAASKDSEYLDFITGYGVYGMGRNHRRANSRSTS